jgi:hypothetical protein
LFVCGRVTVICLNVGGLLSSSHYGQGFRVQGSGFRVQGLGFRVQDLGLRVQGLGFRVQGLGFRVQRLGFRYEWGVTVTIDGGKALGFTVWVSGSAFMVQDVR